MARKGIKRKWGREVVLASLSFALALAVLEMGLRFCLFDSRCPVPGLRNATYFAHPSTDEHWILAHSFTKRWTSKEGSTQPPEASLDFYEGWWISLELDEELGWVRKPDIDFPCHESSNLGTRGVGPYREVGEKIVFFGDSFVESLACSGATLTAKMEKRTGVDVLNFGVGGYGFDQSFLLFDRVVPDLSKHDTVFLVGLIMEDLDRMLLKVRTGPKPYFTAEKGRLVLHTDHINPQNPEEYFRLHPPRRVSYLLDLLMSRLGRKPRPSSEEQQAMNHRKQVLTVLILEEMARIRDQTGMRLALVSFPTIHDHLSAREIDRSFAENSARLELPVIDLMDCLPRPEDEDEPRLYYERGHPNSVAMDLFTECLLDDLFSTFELPVNWKRGISSK